MSINSLLARLWKWLDILVNLVLAYKRWKLYDQYLISRYAIIIDFLEDLTKDTKSPLPQKCTWHMLVKLGLNFSGIVQPLKPTCAWTQISQTQPLSTFLVQTPTVSLLGQCCSTISRPAPFSDISFVKSEYCVSLWKRVGMIWLRSRKKANEAGEPPWVGQQRSQGNGNLSAHPCWWGSSVTLLVTNMPSSASKNPVCSSQSSDWQFPLKHHLPSLPPSHVLSWRGDTLNLNSSPFSDCVEFQDLC